MSIFDSIKNLVNPNGESNIDWKLLNKPEDLEQIVQNSKEAPQIIYKHSTRCAVSSIALFSLQGIRADVVEKADFHFLNVIDHRDLSNYVAEKLNVRHESPQLLLIRNGKVDWHGSHYQVKAETVAEIL